MNATQRKMTIGAALFVFLWTAQTASAWYSPNLQRWLNRDPIEEEGGINLYVAVRNDPIGHWDSYGLAAAKDDCKAACDAARADPKINDGNTRGTVMCTGDGKKCPCVLGYGPLGFDVGDCPAIDKIMEAHEQEHINRGNVACDPKNKEPHKNVCAHHTKKDHDKEECDLLKQTLNDLRKAAKAATGACKGNAQTLADSLQVDYDAKCKK